NRVSCAEVDLGERRGGTAGGAVATCLESDRKCVLEQGDRLFRPPEEEVQTAEIVRQLADVDAIGELRVRLPGALGIRPRQHRVPLAVRDERGLEVRNADRARVVDTLCELERALDIVVRRLVVAL